VDCFQLFQDVVHCQDAVNTVMNLRVQERRRILYCLKYCTFSRRTQILIAACMMITMTDDGVITVL